MLQLWGACLEVLLLFNQDLSNWDVSKVINFQSMFSNATSFNQNISNWDVSSVTFMGGMFSNATSLNQDISNWDVSSVTNMSGMLPGCLHHFNQDIGQLGCFKCY